MRSLALKLTLAFLAVALTGTALLAIFAGQTTASEFGHFMLRQNQDRVVAELAEYYRAQGSWAGVESATPFGEMHVGGGRGMGPGGGIALADGSGRVIIGGAGYRPGAQLSELEIAQWTPIQVNGQVVGGLLLAGRGGFETMSLAGTEFLARVNRALLIAASGATVSALLLGILLARALARPLRELTAATRAVAAGDLEQQLPVRSRDELGELAASFNQMSADLARARDLRRQMTADIAHELRTPLSVILSHAEALRDGVLPATPETLDLIHDETLHLNRLVDDLRTLSLAEAGELKLVRRPVAPQTILERAAAAQARRAQQQNITLQTVIAPDLPEVEVDPDRMAQVFGNLLNNALRHTPAGGSVTLAASMNTAADGVRLSVRDTGPGIPAEDLPRVFDRFYRADKSRQRDGGGSGLGLAIAKSIVEAHGGRIWVESKPGEGAIFTVALLHASNSSRDAV